MPRRDEALASMRDALQLQDPEWDIAPGSPEWKILEAVAQQIENLTFNSVLNDYHFDVDKKSGLELDLFMSLFGYARVRGRRATGEVTFSRGTSATQDYIIPLGTQVFVPATAFAPAIYFQTTTSAVLAQGTTEISVPVQAVVGGTIGNVSVYSITGLATSIGGVTAVLNYQAITGGRDAESDQELRDRWRTTVFRNISGTEDMFRGLAFNEGGYVTRANVVGPIERYTEQIQLAAPDDLTTTSPWETTVSGDIGSTDTSFSVADGTVFSSAPFYAAFYDAGAFREIIYVGGKAGNALTDVVRAGTYNPGANVTIRQVFPSSVTDSKFTYPAGGEIVGLNLGLTTQQVGRNENDYYLITDNNLPHAAGVVFPVLFVTPTGAGNFGLDNVVEMESEYTPLSSRNDPANQIAEKVDMFVDGTNAITVIEQIPMREDYIFGDANTEESDFIRDDGVDLPATGNIFTPLSKSPIVSVPSSITVAATSTTDATTYYKGEDYNLVLDRTEYEGSTRAREGLEWRNPDPAATGVFSATAIAGTGRLDGWYAYKFTFENDGVESLPQTANESASGENDPTSWGKNDLVIPQTGGAGATRWRRIYRSLGSASQAEAEAGPFYLLKVIKDDTTTAWRDNKADSALNLNVQPPKAPPPVDAPISVEYTYNYLVEKLDAQIDLVRLVGMDTLVHQADDIQLKFNLAVVMISGMNISDLKADINTNLFAWINRKNFQGNIQIADVIDVVANSSGVDNVRLARESEARNEVQKVTVTPPATPLTTRDLFTLTIGGVTSGAIVYNDSMTDVRETLEAMSNIQEGNTYATQLNGNHPDPADTSLLVDDNASLHVDGVLTNDPIQPYYIQVDDEICYVQSAVDNGGTITLTVKRAQLGTTAAAHSDNADVHVLGDVAVVRTTAGSSYIYTIHFLPNLYTERNNWGTRELDLLTAAKASQTSQVTLEVEEKVSGSGWGIQKIAHNDLTIIDDFTTVNDIYLASDELPSLFAIDVIVKAQNTF